VSERKRAGLRVAASIAAVGFRRALRACAFARL
jgi:hypothetical protein